MTQNVQSEPKRSLSSARRYTIYVCADCGSDRLARDYFPEFCHECRTSPLRIERVEVVRASRKENPDE